MYSEGSSMVKVMDMKFAKILHGRQHWKNEDVFILLTSRALDFLMYYDAFLHNFD